MRVHQDEPGHIFLQQLLTGGKLRRMLIGDEDFVLAELQRDLLRDVRIAFQRIVQDSPSASGIEQLLHVLHALHIACTDDVHLGGGTDFLYGVQGLFMGLVPLGHIEDNQGVRVVLIVQMHQAQGIRLHHGGIRQTPDRMSVI